ncbi:polyketide synthase dehydratase domain-containing protein, partial [Streptomyces glaucus]|uniref:polyketide synthase dehydratase domain-containing protein n=1 Tax=Streptomyces glaucus TaxID=284029 RepID=UPI0031DF8D82
DRLGAAGLSYGPAFRGLRAVWRHGDDLYAEAALPDSVAREAEGYGLHPALLDAVLHALALRAGEGREETASLPFVWSGVHLSAVGASAVRVRLSPAGEDAVTLWVADATGEPIAAADSLLLRELSSAELAPTDTTVRDSLFRLDWIPLPDVTPGSPADWTLLGALPIPEEAHTRYADLAALKDALDAGASVPETVIVPVNTRSRDITEVAAETLTLVQDWLAAPRLTGARLVFVTSGAVGDDVTDTVGAAVWGLVRSAASEHPDRFGLADVDGSAESYRALAGCLEAAELLIRDGRVRVPRVVRMAGGGVLVPPVVAPGMSWRLDVVARGRLDGVALVAEEPRALGP